MNHLQFLRFTFEKYNMQEKKTHSCSIIIVKALLFTFLLLFTTHSFCVGAHPSLLVAEIIENNEHSIENEAHLYYPFSIEKNILF